jgi:predicted O-methyltransferase YrrM
MRTLGAPFFLLLLSSSAASAFAADSPAFHVPRAQGITVDGQAEDWGRQGFRVEVVTDPDGRALPIDDFDVRFRLAWDPQGLLVLATVRDDIGAEHQNADRLWQRDSIELFLSDAVGSANRFQLVIAPGADPSFETARTRFYDWRPESRRATPLVGQAASRVVEGGYVVEARLPWGNLGVAPEPGRELGFQLVAFDFDGEASPAGLRVAWFPGMSPADPGNTHRIVLTEEPGAPVLFRLDREITRAGCRISVLGASELVGKAIEIRSGAASVVRDRLSADGGRASFEHRPDRDLTTETWPRMDIVVAGEPVAAYEELPTMDRLLARHLEALGGAQALARVTSRTMSGRLVHDRPGQKPSQVTVPVEVHSAAPEQWRLIIRTSRGLEQMGFDGETGWMQDSDRILRDRGQARSRLAYLFNPQGALRLEEYFPGLTVQGRVVREGRTEYVLESRSGGGRYRLHFDAESGLLTRIGDDLTVEDYMSKAGMKHPARVVVRQGTGTSTYVFDTIAPNAPPPTRLLAIPNLGEVFPAVFAGLPDSPVVPLLQDFPPGHEEMSVPCRDGRFLYDFILEKQYRRGLEIGTFTGYSTLWMGAAFSITGGRLVTLEIDRAAGEVARGVLRQAGLERVVDSRIADAFAEIPRLEGTFDLVFIDADKPDYLRFLRLVRDRISLGGAIVAHNVANQAAEMRDFLEAIRNDPGLETTFQELSAEGMSVSIVRGR